MADWNPELYLKYADERTQPARDLAARMRGMLEAGFPGKSRLAVIDLGCGPGNSTAVLRQALTEADLTGLDSSEAMLATARKEGPQATWIQANISDWQATRKFNGVFSNALFQWVPDQERVFKRCLDMLVPGGVFAAQIPGNNGSPLHRAVLETARDFFSSEQHAALADRLKYREPDFYHETLSAAGAIVQVWETTYWHVLADHRALVDWYRSTGMRTWLDALPGETERAEFLGSVLKKVKTSYAERADGSVFFPFRRIFFTAIKTV